MRRVFILLALVLVSFGFTKEAQISAQSVAFSYYSTIYQGDFDETLKLIKFAGKTPNEATFKTIKIYFDTSVKWAKEQGGIKNIALIDSFELQNHRMHFKFEIEYKNGSKDTDEIELIKDGDSWKVFYFVP